MRIEFLWDEDKTRKLFKTHLILFLIGGVVATLYTLLLPAGTPYRTAIASVALLFTLSCSIYLYLLPKPNPGIRFLFFTLQSQLAAAIFMALTGGFLGIVQFAPYMFLLFAVFELGSDSTLILGIFSVITFICILFWSSIFHPQLNSIQQFIYYTGSYILIIFIERNIGIELSLQFAAKRRLEQVDELKNQFIALASHYLRTPLTIIKGFSEELANSDLKDEQKKQIQSVIVSAKQLDNLVEKLITISSIEKGEAKITKANASLNNLVEGIVKDYKPAAAGQQIILDYQPQLPIPDFPFDSTKLGDAIESLIDNAIKFNKPQGTVQIELFSDQKNAIIKISDTGAGIKKDHLETLFTSFNRGTMQQVLKFDKPGIGLSLYMVKLLVEAHGGQITVDSTPGLGSIFTIKIPLQ